MKDFKSEIRTPTKEQILIIHPAQIDWNISLFDRVRDIYKPLKLITLKRVL
jgi:hypothetical protein